MKKTEIATVILIAAISVGVAYFVANAIFGGAKNEAVNVKTIDPITSDFAPVDTKIFNSTAINPAVPVEIKDSSSE
jgi:ABC-type cobalt transport system substrate-binding protein